MALPTVAASVPALAASAPDLAAVLKPFTADAIANGFATLVGALLGAMLAYLLQRLLVRKQEHRAALMSAHRTMFALLQQISTIVLIQRDCVHSELDNLGRFLQHPVGTVDLLPPLNREA